MPGRVGVFTNVIVMNCILITFTQVIACNCNAEFSLITVLNVINYMVKKKVINYFQLLLIYFSAQL